MTQKPAWKGAPEWANYRAMDEDGTYLWFECKPNPASSVWFATEGRVAEAEYSHWIDSLEKRP
jgi:hypothetical protein